MSCMVDKKFFLQFFNEGSAKSRPTSYVGICYNNTFIIIFSLLLGWFEPPMQERKETQHESIIFQNK